jgi:prepilin-type N-terminal cleavage/methylation domain-containing protein
VLVSKAFTLIEVLVVIVIIGLLASLALVVGGKVTAGGQERLTSDTIRALDATVGGYLADRTGKFPSYFEDTQANPKKFPIIDGWGGSATATTGRSADPTIALFVQIASDVSSVDSTIKGIDPKLIKRGDITRTFDNAAARNDQGNISGVFINDAWGRPLRFVVPAFHGGHGRFINASGNVDSARPTLPVRLEGTTTAQYSRSYRAAQNIPGDADEGLCPGNHPYFYSAGEDGDPGTRSDNVYTLRPAFPNETAKLN